MRNTKSEARESTPRGEGVHLVSCLAALLLGLALFTGCESTNGGGGGVSGGAYYGVGIYDPWYHGGDYDSPDYIVTPPPVERPPSNIGAQPEHPIARPPPSAAPRPTPMPSIPSAPRPMPRPAMRR